MIYRGLFALFCFTIVLFTSAAQSPDCCADTHCKQVVETLASQINNEVPGLGSYPSEDDKRFKILNDFKFQHPTSYRKIAKIIEKASRLNDTNATALLCFQSFLTNEDVIKWVTFLSLVFDDVTIRSPEFRKGSGIHLDLNQGAGNLFQSDEEYSLSVRVLYAYTIARNQTGGSVRLMIGPSMYYQGNKAALFANPRIEFRIKDIGNYLTSIGNIKLITNANFNYDKVIAGIGTAVELSNFGFQLLGEWQSKDVDYSLHVGLFYRFDFKK